MTDRTPHHADQDLAGTLNPGLAEALRDRYGRWLPDGVDRAVVDYGWGQVYAREGLDIRTRMLITIGALAALGGQTRPQLKVNIATALKAGATPREICEAIFQMHLYGGMPAMINALNAAIEVFEAEGLEGGAA